MNVIYASLFLFSSIPPKTKSEKMLGLRMDEEHAIHKNFTKTKFTKKWPLISISSTLLFRTSFEITRNIRYTVGFDSNSVIKQILLYFDILRVGYEKFDSFSHFNSQNTDFWNWKIIKNDFCKISYSRNCTVSHWKKLLSGGTGDRYLLSMILVDIFPRITNSW